MGPLGASLGLALKNIRLKNTEVVGHFLNRKTQSEVNKMDAFDSIEGNLGKAVDGAQIVVSDFPINETRDLFETLGSLVSDGAVITDMGSSKKRSAAWAEEFLPNTVSYVGGRPIIKVQLEGVAAASGNLFEGVNYCVIPSKSADDCALDVYAFHNTVGKYAWDKIEELFKENKKSADLTQKIISWEGLLKVYAMVWSGKNAD